MGVVVIWHVLRWALVPLVGVLAVGCATSYHAMPQDRDTDSILSGYGEREIRAGVYQLHYNANPSTSPEQTRNYWHRRASELCGSANYGYDLREDEDFDWDVAYASGMVYTSQPQSPRFYGVVDCERSGRLALFRATRAEIAAAKNPAQVVQIPDSAEPLSFFRLSCDSYYALVQNCSRLTGADLHVSFDGVKFRMAASARGNRLLLQLPNTEPAYSDKYDANEYINTVYYIAKNVIEQGGLAIEAVTPVKSMWRGVKAYLVAVSGDGYTHLKAHADRGTPTLATD